MTVVPSTRESESAVPIWRPIPAPTSVASDLARLAAYRSPSACAWLLVSVADDRGQQRQRDGDDGSGADDEAGL